MIVDQAEADIEMQQDPFLEAGITIPGELPHGTPEKATALGRTISKPAATVPKDLEEGNEVEETNGLIC